jgi:hypothetical protein
MSERLNIKALAGSKEGSSTKGFTVPLFVSVTNDLGQPATGYKAGHFEVKLLQPNLDREERRLFQLEMSTVSDLGSGCYKVVCKNAVGTGFVTGPLVLFLTIKKPAAKGSEPTAAQTLVSVVVDS